MHVKMKRLKNASIFVSYPYPIECQILKLNGTFPIICWFMYVTERAPNDTGYMWRAHAHADALASVIDSVAGHGCVSKKCYQI